jgi:hypothetical protein
MAILQNVFHRISCARILIDVIDVIDHAWRPIDTPADSCWALCPSSRAAIEGSVASG